MFVGFNNKNFKHFQFNVFRTQTMLNFNITEVKTKHAATEVGCRKD